MSVSKSRLSYEDVFDVFSRASDDKHGIRIAFKDEGTAKYYRLRMNYARTIDRQDNKQIYELGHPMHGRSSYDHLMTTIREIDGVWYLYLIPINDASRLQIESLEGKDIDPPQSVTVYEPPKRLEAPQPIRRITFRR